MGEQPCSSQCCSCLCLSMGPDSGRGWSRSPLHRPSPLPSIPRHKPELVGVRSTWQGLVLPHPIPPPLSSPAASQAAPSCTCQQRQAMTQREEEAETTSTQATPSCAGSAWGVEGFGTHLVGISALSPATAWSCRQKQSWGEKLFWFISMTAQRQSWPSTQPRLVGLGRISRDPESSLGCWWTAT